MVGKKIYQVVQWIWKKKGEHIFGRVSGGKEGVRVLMDTAIS